MRLGAWPDPPWDAIQYVGAVVLIISVLVAYPFAKTLWLAIDLVFRPVAAKELGWYKGDAAVETAEKK